jgi:type VI secretion system protein ImpJ
MTNKTTPQTVSLPLEALRGRAARSTSAANPASPARVPNDDDVYALHKPDWPKGLQLLPQHFEAQVVYHERRMAFALGLLFDHPWGIADVALNSDAIQAGEIAVRRFEGIFPDGTPVSIGGVAGSNALARSFEAALRARESADVYLGLLREVPERPMIDGSDGSTDPRRFARRSTTRPELGTGQNGAAVPWLRPNIRILFEGEPVEEYSVLRIARLLRAPKGRAVLDRKFVPSVTRIRASPGLQEILQGIEQRIVETRTALASQRREGQESTKSDAARAVLLMMLGRMVPRVSDLLGLNVHPREAYSALAELVGALSPFGAEGTFTIPRFDFLELGATFDAIATQVHQILASITASRYRAVPLTRQDEFLRWTALREPGIFGKEFLLTIGASDPTRFRLHVPLVAKVGAYEHIGSLISAAVPGVALTAEQRRPAGLDLPAQTVCFRLEQQGEHWDEVMRRGSLGVYLPEPYQHGDVALFVKERGILE